MKLSTISEILHNPHRTVQTTSKYNTYELPFVNCRHRSRVRVVDVYPSEVRLFAHSTRDGKWSKRPKRQSSTGTHVKEKWEWAFVLLLEDANIPRDTVSEKLRVVVNNDAAQYLLTLNATK
jgi:protection-of-telomeres protein 1